MSYTIEESKIYEQEQKAVYNAAIKAITGLEGKFINHDEATGTLEAKFHKTVLKKTLGDRTQLKVVVTANSPTETTVAATIYPLDAIGRQLMFGARKGVSRTVLNWFNAHLEHHLQQ